jgi:3-hydroxyacyl-[acyl-carrier-protein] dehydratase
MNLDLNLLELLPHRPPFLFLDGLVAYRRDEASAEGVKTYSADTFLLSGLKAAHPVVPASLLIESMAQLSAVLSQLNQVSDQPQRVPGPGYLIAITDFVYHEPVCLGEQTRIRAQLTHVFGNMRRSRCSLNVGSKLCASAELSFQIEL